MSASPQRDRLLALVDAFDRVRVLAFVDLVADEYVTGRSSRVSREAPVLILDYDETHRVPGGGANAVHNLSTLGGRASAVGLVGGDPAGKELLAQLRRAGVECSAVLRSRSYRTPTKTRILAGGVHSSKQQVVRIDRRSVLPGNADLAAHLAAAVDELLPGSDVAMVSDYDYGFITPSFGCSLAQRARSLGKRAVLDSRRALCSYPGFSSATPNEPEVEAALGVAIGHDRAALERSGRKLLSSLRCQALLVTRGSDGMALFEPRRPTRHIPIHGSDEVADVTGAGDTVLSAYTLALGAGASFYEAALLANYAGGIVVMKRGTATVSREELREAVVADGRL